MLLTRVQSSRFIEINDFEFDFLLRHLGSRDSEYPKSTPRVPDTFARYSLLQFKGQV